MKRWVAIVSVTGLFVIGILIGSLGTHLYYAHHLLRPGEPHRWAHGRFADMLRNRLELTPEQRQEIDEILVRAHERSEAIRSEVGPRVRDEMERTHERIMSLLTEEQREEFHRMVQSHHRLAEQFFLGDARRHRGPPPEPHP